MSCLRGLRIPVLALAVTASTGPLYAQSLRGRVIEAETGRPLEGVHLLLVVQEGTAVAESFSGGTGSFVLTANQPGAYRLTAQHLGYTNVRSDLFQLGANESHRIEVRMAVEPVPVEAVTVRSPTRSGSIAGFYERMNQGGRTGQGYFIDREDLDRHHGGKTTDLLRRVPGTRVSPAQLGRPATVRMRGHGGGCSPSVYLDGIQLALPPGVGLDTYVNPMDVEGIEVYRGMGTAPVRYTDRNACGVILIWTRPGEPSHSSFSWIRTLVIGGLFAGLILVLH